MTSDTHRVMQDISYERQRQMVIEHWTPQHDDEHDQGEMAAAAACYAMPPKRLRKAAGFPIQWPWDPKWWKPKDRRHDLVRAAALIVAEIERMDRASSLNGEADRG